MYRPQHFKTDDHAILKDLITQNSFATLVTQDADGLVANHLPLLLEIRNGEWIITGHMAKANPQWKHFENDREVLVIFQGPHTYISPSWYGEGTHVPTWNYAAVHIYGKPEVLNDDQTYSLLEKMVNHYESAFPKPWRLDLPEGEKRGMLRAIVGFEIPVGRIEGKLKMSQNRDPEDQKRVMEALSQSTDAMNRAVAEIMRKI